MPALHDTSAGNGPTRTAVELAQSIGSEVAYTAVVPLRGQGQMVALGAAIEEHAVELAVVDAALSPVQQRNAAGPCAADRGSP